MAIDWVSTTIDAVSSVLGGIGNASQKRQQYKANAADAAYQLDLLSSDYDRLEQTFNESMQELGMDLSNTLRSNSQNLWATGVSQLAGAQAAAHTNTANQASMYTQLASIQREGMASVGTAVASTAASGFRDTGTGAAVISEAERVADSAYQTSLRQIQASAYGAFMQASSEYFSANIQKESYRQSSRMARQSYDLQSSALKTQLEYEQGRNLKQQEYYQGVKESNDAAANSGWRWFLDFLGGF